MAGVCESTQVAIDGELQENWRFLEVVIDNHIISTAIDRGTGISSGKIKVVKFEDLKVEVTQFGEEKYFQEFYSKKECP